MTCLMNPKACPMNPDDCPIHPFNTLRSLKAYYSIYMSLNTLDLPPFDRILNTLQCVVHCGHPMRRQSVISEFKVAIAKKCPMNPGFTLICLIHFIVCLTLCILMDFSFWSDKLQTAHYKNIGVSGYNLN